MMLRITASSSGHKKSYNRFAVEKIMLVFVTPKATLGQPERRRRESYTEGTKLSGRAHVSQAKASGSILGIAI